MNEFFILKTRLDLYYEKIKANEFRMKTEYKYTCNIFKILYSERKRTTNLDNEVKSKLITSNHHIKMKISFQQTIENFQTFLNANIHRKLKKFYMIALNIKRKACINLKSIK